jgi:hypothetical protein
MVTAFGEKLNCDHDSLGGECGNIHRESLKEMSLVG